MRKHKQLMYFVMDRSNNNTALEFLFILSVFQPQLISQMSNVHVGSFYRRRHQKQKISGEADHRSIFNFMSNTNGGVLVKDLNQ